MMNLKRIAKTFPWLLAIAFMIGLGAFLFDVARANAAPPPVVANTIKLGPSSGPILQSVYAGNPNGVVSGNAGDTIWDTSTPAYWQCQGGTVWLKVTSVSGTGTPYTMVMWTGPSALGNSLITTDSSGDLNMNPARTVGQYISTIVKYMDTSPYDAQELWRINNYVGNDGSGPTLAYNSMVVADALVPYTPASGYPNPLYDHTGQPYCYNYGRPNTGEPQVCNGGFESGWINGNGAVPQVESYNDYVGNDGYEHRWFANTMLWDGTVATMAIEGSSINFADWNNPTGTIAAFYSSITPTTTNSTLILGGLQAGYAGTSLSINSNGPSLLDIQNGNQTVGYLEVNVNGIVGMGPLGLTATGNYTFGGSGAGSSVFGVLANNNADVFAVYVDTNGDVDIYNQTPSTSGYLGFYNTSTGGFPFVNSTGSTVLYIQDSGETGINANTGVAEPFYIEEASVGVLDVSYAGGLIYVTQGAGALFAGQSAVAGDVYDTVTNSTGNTLYLTKRAGATGEGEVQSSAGPLVLISGTGSDVEIAPGFVTDTVDFGLSATALADNNIFGWSALPSATTATIDTAFARNSVGVIEIDNGTAGVFRDLDLRNLTATGSATVDSGGYFTGDTGFSNTAAAFTPATTLDVRVNNATPLEIFNYKSTNSGTKILLGRGRGTIASPLSVLETDMLMSIAIYGYDSNNALDNDALFSTNVDQTVSAGIVPSNYQIALQDNTGSNQNRFRIDSGGHIIYPQITSPSPSSCGTSPTIAGTDNGGVVTPGTGATGCTLTFALAWNTTDPGSTTTCTVTSQSSITYSYSYNETTITISSASAAGNSFNWSCSGY